MEDEKRFTLRIDAALWRRLRIEAAKRGLSAVRLINVWLLERVEAAEKEED